MDGSGNRIFAASGRHALVFLLAVYISNIVIDSMHHYAEMLHVTSPVLSGLARFSGHRHQIVRSSKLPASSHHY
jgi:hypothetical protein